MLKFKRLLALVLIPLLLNMTGCWSVVEPEKYAWVTWMGIDRTPDGKIRITLGVLYAPFFYLVSLSNICSV